MADTDPPASDAAPTKPYPVGVMFVHGIGEQPLGDTLKNVADPIVRHLDAWIHGAARCRGLALGEAPALEWAQKLPLAPGGPTSGAGVREQAFEMAWSAQWKSVDLTPRQADDMRTSGFWSGGAVLGDGKPGGDDGPTHAVLRVHTTGAQYELQQGEALVAESWWARSFVPPGASALLSWTFKVLPLAIGMHMGDSVRRHVQRAGDPGLGWHRRVMHVVLSIVCMAGLAVAVPLALPLQCLLVASVVLGLLPLRFVQDAMRTLQSALLGTLGDSFLLVSSPVSRAMIVAQCKRDLHWLAQRCDRVMVVAHSQGCAVSYLALCEAWPQEVRDVTWVGSGLRKLEILRATERDASTAFNAWCVATMPFVAWVLVSGMVNKWSWDSAPGQMVFTLLALLLYLLGFIRLAFLLRVGTTDLWLPLWRQLQLRLTDLYASHDPVPHGPLFDEPTAPDDPLQTREVRNQASMLSDHTTYWRNMEEVTLPLALRIAAGAGVPVARLLASDGDWLAHGVVRRHARVTTLVWLRRALLVGGAGVVVFGPAVWGQLGSAALTQGWAWLWGSTVDANALTSPLRLLLPELLLWVGLPFVLLVLCWRGWEAFEQRCFLNRTQPGQLEWPLLSVMVAAAFTPAGHAAALVGGDKAAGAAIAIVMMGSLAFGLFHWMIVRGDRRPAKFERAPNKPP
jgi:hypothetical protein